MSTPLKMKVAVPSCPHCNAEDYGSQDVCTNCGTDWEYEQTPVQSVILRSEKNKYFSKEVFSLEELKNGLDLLDHKYYTIYPSSMKGNELWVSDETCPGFASSKEAIIRGFA